MYGNAANLFSDHLTLTGVDSDSSLDPKFAVGLARGTGVPDGSSRTIERRHEAIAGRIDFATTKPGQLCP